MNIKEGMKEGHRGNEETRTSRKEGNRDITNGKKLRRKGQGVKEARSEDVKRGTKARGKRRKEGWTSNEYCILFTLSEAV